MSIATKTAIKKAIRTFVFATAGLAVPGLLGWLNDLTDWAHSQGTTPFPDAHGLAFIFVAAISAGFIAVLNLIVLLLENSAGRGFLRNPRVDDRGAVSLIGLLIIVVVIALLLYFIF